MKKLILRGIVVTYAVVSTGAWFAVSAARRVRRWRAPTPPAGAARGYGVGRF